MTKTEPIAPLAGEVDRIPPSQVALGGFQPVLVLKCHGILTGETEPDWSDFGEKWLEGESSRFSVLNVEYFEWPLPRVAMIRNRKRAEAFLLRAEREISRLWETYGVAPMIYLVGHSNGAYLIDLVAEGLIANGHTIEGMLFMAPAVRAKHTTRRCAAWIEDGQLQKAALVIAERDRLVGFLRWDPMKIVAFPWGALGREGWRLNEIPEHITGRFETVSLASNHSGFLNRENRERTYEEIIGPFVGWSPDEEGRLP